ncbi:ATP-binding protein [Umezawaea sp.]|uniref:ATP-binding protein n=1 Tax=Umezawaea sp. TaxID=1955258 RepID=UPI002ED282D2
MTSNSMSGVSGNLVQAGAIAGGVHFHAPSEVTRTPRQLPAPPRGFGGRDALLAAVDRAVFDAPAGTVPVVVLTGMGGVGKTALAVSWAHRAADRFPDGQFHVDLHGFGAEQPSDAGEVLGSFLRALGVEPENLPVGTEERAALFRSRLSERRVVVVLDNARDEEQVRPLVPGAGSCVLVTSRANLTGLVVDHGAVPLAVDVLAEAEALDLLATLVGDRVRDEPEAAAECVRHCAGLPLALRVVAGYASYQPDVPLADLVAALADERSRLDALDSGDPRTAVRTVFSWSYRRLPPDAARLFRLLGLVPGADVGRAAVAALADVPVRGVNRLLAVLFQAQVAVDAGRGRVGMHDLLRVYAAELAEEGDREERRTALVRLFDHHLHGAAQADVLLSPRRFRVALDGSSTPVEGLDSRESALDWMTAEHEVLAALFQVGGPELDARRWQLAYTMRGYFFLTKDWDTWVRTHRTALAATQRLGDLAAEASTRNNLGLALLERGDPEAAGPHYLRAQEIFEQVGDLRGAGNAMGNYAWILHGRADHEGALEWATRALANYERCGARTNAGITLRGIAIFEAALGRFPEAVNHLHDAMAVFEERSSPLDQLMAHNSLGEVHCQAGNPTAAAAAHHNALARAVEQGSRFERARAHRGLARAAQQSGDHDQAKTELRTAADLFTALNATAEAAEATTALAALEQ